MKVIFSNYNFTPDWIKDYDFDYFIYDRSDSKEYLKNFPQEKIKYVSNLGSDILDKFDWIIEHYDDLPDVVLLSKSNMFKFITVEEFEKIKDNKTFTPLLTQGHKTYSDNEGIVCYYQDGMYYERNDYWYLTQHKPRNYKAVEDLKDLLQLRGKDYIPFAPGASYILTKQNILKHSKEDYKLLRSYLAWDRYPGEAMLMERGLYLLWQ